MKSVLGIVLVAASAPFVLSATYLLLLAAASAFTPRFRRAMPPAHRLAVVIPAHDEERLIGRCVDSMLSQSLPRPLFQVIVIADNCSDSTAITARAAGAEVWVRSDPRRGKGQALRWAFDKLLGNQNAPDAVVVVDADAVADPDFLLNLEARFGAGQQVLQADDLLLTRGATGRAALEGVALLLRNRVRFAGRAALGMQAGLCGNGMLIATRVLRQHPWSAFGGTEDGEYSLHLRAAGVPIHFAPEAKIYAAPTGGGRGAYTQGLRWERGRFELMGAALTMSQLAWSVRRPGLLTTALDLAIPPLGVITLVTAGGTFESMLLVAIGWAPRWSVLPWAAAAVAVPLYVLLALFTAHAPASAYRALLMAPLFLARKVSIYARLLAGAHAGDWIRTQR